MIALHLRVGTDGALPGRGELVAGGVAHPEIPVVLGDVIEPGFVGLEDGDEAILIRVAPEVEPVVVPADLREHLGQERAPSFAP